jgi:hypothetical protein
MGGEGEEIRERREMGESLRGGGFCWGSKH